MKRANKILKELKFDTLDVEEWTEVSAISQKYLEREKLAVSNNELRILNIKQMLH